MTDSTMALAYLSTVCNERPTALHK